MSSRLRLAFAALLLASGLFPAVGEEASPAGRDRIAALLAAAEASIDNSARPTAAIPLSRQALLLALEMGDAPLEARARRDLAWALVIENAADGLARSQEALAAARRAGDRVLEVSALDLVGNAEYYLNRHVSALRHFREALALARAAGVPELQATALKDAGATLHVLGELDQAMMALRESADLFLSVGDRAEAASALSNLGGCYAELGANGPALDAYEKSLAVGRELDHAPLVADLLTRIGFHLLRLGRPGAALERFDEAIAVARGHRLEFVIGWASAGRQQALFESGLAPQAIAEAEEDLRQGEAAGDRTRVSKDLEGLCRFLLDSDPARSRDCFAGLIARTDLADRRVWVAHAGLARARLRLGDTDGAVAAYETAIGNIQSLRAGVLSEEHRASFFGSFASVFEELAGVLLERGSPVPSPADAARAFEVLERGRALARLEGLEERRLDLPGPIPEDLLARQQALEARLSALENGSPGDAVDASTQAELEQTEERLDALRVEMRRRDPRAAALAEIAVTSASQLRSSLDDATAVVTFALTPRSAWALVATRGAFEAVRLPVRVESLGEEVANYVGLLSRSEKADWRTFGRRLHAEIVAPWRPRMPAGVRRLVVIPDGALHSLPFEVLEAADGTPRPLLQDFAISYGPSATVWQRLENAARPSGRDTRRDLLAIANPSAPSARESKTARLYAEEGYRSRPLRFAGAEVEAISRFGGPGSQTWIGAAADEQMVKRSALGQFRVLHFAAHAFVNDQLPWRSALLLPGNGSGQEDGFLQAREISRLKLDSDLVVLSACQSGSGRLVPGEGLQGLAEAFFDAGARSVVASLWDVDDERTAALMQDFYGHLADGAPISEALASAKRDQLRRAAGLAPRYWAAFILMGESGGRIPFRRPSDAGRWAGWGAAGAMAVACGIFVWRRSRAVSGARG